MVGDAQVIPISMPSCEDVEVSPPPIDLSFIPSIPHAQQDEFPCPCLPMGAMPQNTVIFHVRNLLSKVLTADGSQDDIRINHLLIHLCPKCQSIGHQVVHQAGAPLGVAVDGGKGCLVDDGGRAPGTGDLVEDVLCHLRIRESGKVVVHGNALAQGLMDGLFQGAVQVGLAAEDEREAVQGVIPIVHEHLDILQDAGGEVLCLIDCQEEGLLLVLVKVEDLLLYGAEHARLAAPWLHPQDRAELAVELHDADGGEADVLHVVEVGVKAPCKAAQGEGLAHAGACGEQPDAPGVLQVIQTGRHLRDVP